MAALVAEFAYVLGCVGPAVPWICLWLTRGLPGMFTSDWCLSAQGRYVGVVLGYVMGDETAFTCWSRLCIRYGRDTRNFVGIGCVWYIMNRKLFYHHV